MCHTEMKVVWLCSYPINTIRSIPGLAGVGGHPSTWIRNLSNAIQTYFPEVDLHVITETTRVRRDVFFEEGGVKFHVLRSGSSIPLLTKGWPAFMPMDIITKYEWNCRKIIRILDEIKPEIVHAHGTEAAYARAAVLSGYPCVVTLQGLITKLSKYYRNNWSFQLRVPLERFVFETGHYFIAKTRFMAEVARQYNPSSQIFKIPNVVHRAFLKEYPAATDSNTLLFVGSILPQKGIEVLIDAMAELPNFHLKMVGSGSPRYVRKINRKIRKMELDDRVRVCPTQTSKEIALTMAQSFTLVLPSFMESSPNVISEAMCIGLPVIASNVGGIPDMIQDGITGVLVHPKNPVDLSEAVALLKNDSAKTEEIIKEAKSIAVSRHDARSIAEKTIEAYEMILCKGGHSEL